MMVVASALLSGWFCCADISFPMALPYIDVDILRQNSIHPPFFIKRTIGIGHRYIYTTEVKVKLETKFGLIPGGEDIERGICSIVSINYDDEFRVVVGYLGKMDLNITEEQAWR